MQGWHENINDIIMSTIYIMIVSWYFQAKISWYFWYFQYINLYYYCLLTF